MQHNLGIAQLTLAVGLTMAVSTIASASVVLSDGDFTDVSTYLYNSDPAGTTNIATAPCTNCGNSSGAGFSLVQDSSLSTAIGTITVNALYIDNLLTYDPATQGAINKIGGSVDKNETFSGLTCH